MTNLRQPDKINNLDQIYCVSGYAHVLILGI